MWGNIGIAFTKMSSTESNIHVYSSIYEHGVDEKRRVQLPAKWRLENPDAQYLVVPWPKDGMKAAYLVVLPPEAVRTLHAKVKAMPYSDPRAQSLRRLLGGGSDTVTLDKAGRFCLPEGLAKAAGIDKQATLVGAMDLFEIWNPERYSGVKPTDEALAQDAVNLI